MVTVQGDLQPESD